MEVRIHSSALGALALVVAAALVLPGLLGQPAVPRPTSKLVGDAGVQRANCDCPGALGAVCLSSSA